MSIRRIDTDDLKVAIAAEMEYRRNPYCREVLAEGKYKGIQFYILSLGVHPCAYVRYDYTRTPDIEDKITCHGGITFKESQLLLPGGYKPGNILGWDYTHCGDFSGLYLDETDPFWANGEKHTVDEMIQDCIDVIDQLLKFEEDE